MKYRIRLLRRDLLWGEAALLFLLTWLVPSWWVWVILAILGTFLVFWASVRHGTMELLEEGMTLAIQETSDYIAGCWEELGVRSVRNSFQITIKETGDTVMIRPEEWSDPAKVRRVLGFRVAEQNYKLAWQDFQYAEPAWIDQAITKLAETERAYHVYFAKPEEARLG